ncbi:MAG TPA: hypothetical protein VF215_13575, partial [Thermoanaerobaculia bacterium]
DHAATCELSVSDEVLADRYFRRLTRREPLAKFIKYHGRGPYLVAIARHGFAAVRIILQQAIDGRTFDPQKGPITLGRGAGEGPIYQFMNGPAALDLIALLGLGFEYECIMNDAFVSSLQAGVLATPRYEAVVLEPGMAEDDAPRTASDLPVTSAFLDDLRDSGGLEPFLEVLRSLEIPSVRVSLRALVADPEIAYGPEWRSLLEGDQEILAAAKAAGILPHLTLAAHRVFLGAHRAPALRLRLEEVLSGKPGEASH